MKKIISYTLMSCVALYSYAQKINSTKVPANVKGAFAKAHAGVNASWEKEDGNYEVNFKETGKTMSCVIDAKGNILETETDIPVSELPSGVASYIRSHYKNAKIKEAAIIVKSNGEKWYEAEVNGKDLLFDSRSKFIKAQKD